MPIAEGTKPNKTVNKRVSCYVPNLRIQKGKKPFSCRPFSDASVDFSAQCELSLPELSGDYMRFKTDVLTTVIIWLLGTIGSCLHIEKKLCCQAL